MDHCRFCIQQFQKLRIGKISSLSSYCPLQLFSSAIGQFQSMLHLFETPQNNLTCFLDGQKCQVSTIPLSSTLSNSSFSEQSRNTGIPESLAILATYRSAARPSDPSSTRSGAFYAPTTTPRQRADNPRTSSRIPPRPAGSARRSALRSKPGHSRPPRGFAPGFARHGGT